MIWKGLDIVSMSVGPVVEKGVISVRILVEVEEVVGTLVEADAVLLGRMRAQVGIIGIITPHYFYKLLLGSVKDYILSYTYLICMIHIPLESYFNYILVSFLFFIFE